MKEVMREQLRVASLNQFFFIVTLLGTFYYGFLLGFFWLTYEMVLWYPFAMVMMGLLTMLWIFSRYRKAMNRVFEHIENEEGWDFMSKEKEVKDSGLGSPNDCTEILKLADEGAIFDSKVPFGSPLKKIARKGVVQ